MASGERNVKLRVQSHMPDGSLGGHGNRSDLGRWKRLDNNVQQHGRSFAMDPNGTVQSRGMAVLG